MKKILFLSIVAFLLVSCSPTQVDTPTVEPTVEEVAEPTETATLEPTNTNTPEPTDTPTLEPTATSTSTITPTPTEIVKFDEVRIIGVDDLGNYASIIFEFFGIKSPYFVRINGSPYNCVVPEDTEDRMFCTGNELRLDEYASVSFYDFEDESTELFTGDIYVPKPYATPMPAGDPRTWCPLRGTNVTCETEHRIEDGEECWVMTCFDACGYYYSYHTCKYPPNNNFLKP